MLLDLNFFRRDQIWFAEKNDETCATELYSLASFSPRKGENVRKGYLQGRFGAIPFIGGNAWWVRSEKSMIQTKLKESTRAVVGSDSAAVTLCFRAEDANGAWRFKTVIISPTIKRRNSRRFFRLFLTYYFFAVIYKARAKSSVKELFPINRRILFTDFFHSL